MKRALWLTVAIIGLSGVSRAEIWTAFSDTGLPLQNAFAGQNPFAPAVEFNGSSSVIGAPEGFYSWQTVVPAGVSGFWGGKFMSLQNLTRFSTGEIRFWVNSTRPDIRLEVKRDAATLIRAWTLADLGWTAADSGRWRLMRAPLAGLDLSQVDSPFVFVFDAGAAVTFYVDHVRYVDSTILPTFNANLRNFDGSPASDITFNVPDLPATWVLSEQYLDLEIDMNTAPWGVQIYTDNQAADVDLPFRFVSPVPAGEAGSNPAGLVMRDPVPERALNMAWRIRANTLATKPVAGDPAAVFGWMYFKDLNTPNIPSQATTAFTPGEPYVVARNNVGIHYGPGNFDFGAEASPNPVYFQANFGTASTPNSYQGKIVVELFTP